MNINTHSCNWIYENSGDRLFLIKKFHYKIPVVQWRVQDSALKIPNLEKFGLPPGDNGSTKEQKYWQIATDPCELNRARQKQSCEINKQKEIGKKICFNNQVEFLIKPLYQL